jgi:hypothetical protein
MAAVGRVRRGVPLGRALRRKIIATSRFVSLWQKLFQLTQSMLTLTEGFRAKSIIEGIAYVEGPIKDYDDPDALAPKTNCDLQLALRDIT